MAIRYRLLVVVLCFMTAAGAATYYQAQSAADLVNTTNTFLKSLNPEQLNKVKFDFAVQERMNFHYTPVERKGLPLKEMQAYQQDLVYAMIAASLSRRGAMKASTIRSLEQVLGIIESRAPAAAPGNRGNNPPAAGAGQGNRGGRGGGFVIVRDPELYFVSIFGEPSATGRWGWRFEGHHISVNLTMDKGNYISSAPTFLGANPAEVREGPQQGLRVLAAEEDLARKLMASLNAEQKKTATITKYWQGNDILSAEKISFDIGNPVGLQATKMTATQKENLVALIEEYAGRVAPEAAMRAMNEVRLNNGIDKVFFSWIGTETRGQAHYYRVHAPSFVIEYENSQNNANHIHSTFRDLKNDFGQDALRAHLIQDHGFATGN